jgi:hypothetical protein
MYRAEDISEGNEGLPRAVAAHHAREGFEPVLVGITTGLGAEVPMNNEIPTVLVPGTVADIRRFLLESEVSFVHAIAGIGVDVAKAIRFTNLTFVCGLHFNGVASVHDPDVFSTDGAVSEHQELLSVLESAGAVYTGSRLAQRAVEKVFGVRCSIISDVPAD